MPCARLDDVWHGRRFMRDSSALWILLLIEAGIIRYSSVQTSVDDGVDCIAWHPRGGDVATTCLQECHPA